MYDQTFYEGRGAAGGGGGSILKKCMKRGSGLVKFCL